ncbi:MAG: sigma-70 family RNA polymerase sigma factor [Nitrospirae bacterium]|nr:sigma-70 family RNA polymerase sigma factor [Nitrospirota bacterium]
MYNNGIKETGVNDETEKYVREFQLGNRERFDEIVRRHKDRVFNLCYRFLGDYHEAEDVAQDVFMKVYGGLGDFRFQSSFSTWLYRVTVNTCNNKIKSGEFLFFRKLLSFHKPDAGENPLLYEIPDVKMAPDKAIENKELESIIHKAIMSLPSEQRTVVVLRDVEGLSYEEISAITGFNLGTVKSKLSRARLHLRDKLKGKI